MAFRLAAIAIALAGCGPSDGWTEVLRGLPGGLPSVWGTSSADVWTVGGDAGDGPLVLHYDGARWERRRTGTHGDLWWVFGFDAGPVFMGGARGQIVRYVDGGLASSPTPGGSTVFGIWGTAPDDLWAVGGSGPTGGFVWRFDGATWSAVTGLPPVATTVPIYKVWGRARDDVWMVGAGGVSVHFDGRSFTLAPTGTVRDVFTVHGSATRVAAVGGDGFIGELDGDRWTLPPSLDAHGAPDHTPLAGVHCTATAAYAVGQQAHVKRRDDAGWVDEDTGLSELLDLHGVWVDPDGGVWTVGGQLVAEPISDGILLHRGPAVADVVAGL